MSGVAFGDGQDSGMVGGLTDFLCGFIPHVLSRHDRDDDSILRVEATAKEFDHNLTKLSESDRNIILSTVMDVFVKDEISIDDIITMMDNLKRCEGAEMLFSQQNYEMSLPPNHGKAYLRKKVQCAYDNLRIAYDSMGRSMIGITDDDEYADTLISHMVLYRSMCLFEAAIDNLKKRRTDTFEVNSDITEASVALIRLMAFIYGKYSTDGMQSTYSKMLAGESLITFYSENGEAI